MIIQFKSIHMHNFCSYVDAELNLRGKGFCLVSGRNEYKKDGALSNGSGKSTIWSAICYALTGETLSGIKNNLKRLGADNEEMYVELTLEVDGDTYTIKRGEN